MKNNNGFTLVELLVTLGVIAIVVVVSSDFFFNLVDTSVRVQNRNQVEQDYNFIATKISKLVQDSNSVSVTDGGNTLTVVFPTNTVTIKYDPTNFSILIDGTPLTSSNVKIEKINDSTPIFKIEKPFDPQQVSFKAKVIKDKGLSKFEFSQNLERIITVRKSYRN